MKKNIDFNNNIFINNEKIDKISNYIDLNKNVSIIGDTGSGKTTLLKKIIDEILYYNSSEIFIISEDEEELKFYNEKVSAYIQNEAEAIKKLKSLSSNSKSNITIIVDNLNKIIRNEELGIIISNLFNIGLTKGINIIVSFCRINTKIVDIIGYNSKIVVNGTTGRFFISDIPTEKVLCYKRA